MKKKSVLFFALSVVFLSVSFVFFSMSEISLAKYLIFLLNGMTAGVLIANGVMALKK